MVRAPDIVAGFRDLLQVHLCRWSYDFENFLIFSTALIQFRSSTQHLEFTLLVLTRKQARNNPVSGFCRAFAFENVACGGSEKSLKTSVPNPRDGLRVLHDCTCAGANFVLNLKNKR